MQNPSTQPAFRPFTSTAQVEQALASKAEFIAALEEALTYGKGFAAAKLGVSEEKVLLLLQLRESSAPLTTQRVLAVKLKTEAGETAGIFPATADGLAQFAQVYRTALRELDYLGLILDEFAPTKAATLNYHQLTNRLLRFQDLHPDRSIPDDPTNCYLPLLQGKRILIVNPFGKLLAARATCEIFEGVWQVSGKKFFDPASVEALEFPYGFARETWSRYANVLELMHEIKNGCKHTTLTSRSSPPAGWVFRLPYMPSTWARWGLCSADIYKCCLA